MSNGKNNPGVAALAETLSAVSKNGQQGADKILDYGEILWDGSLLCNTYKVAIPKGSYMICRSIAWPNSDAVNTTTNGGHKKKYEIDFALASPTGAVSGTVGPLEINHSPHKHEVERARPCQRHLQPGDHVLVAWIGYDACVIDIIVPATDVL